MSGKCFSSALRSLLYSLEDKDTGRVELSLSSRFTPPSRLSSPWPASFMT